MIQNPEHSTEPYTIGIDLGGSSVKSAVATVSGHVRATRQVDFDPSAEMQWAIRIRELVNSFEQEQGYPASHIGLAAPGLPSRDGNAIAFMPGRLRGLEGLVWSEYLARKHQVPILNDAQAALLGEVWQGTARGERNVILITLGTGVGGAAMVDGHLLRGEIGRAGHLGHMSLNPEGTPDICGTPGSLERAMGNCTIHERSHGRFNTTHDLVKAAEAGDSFAQETWIRSVRDLAAAITSFINILDPAVVIVGGGIARSGETLFKPLRQRVAETEWAAGGHRARIVPATLGEYAGALGAARWGCIGITP